ncbi:unnamed protein product [Protopolystoma xenopodis]|uniref:Uncharacterized protein n=1 Tax=Protopolystoma xenopodis TaxID=117903 RepID=A0A3S5A5Q9_9PLAT|nr:unnamed protein product [Protopolystoma xenopodis]
MKAHNLARGAQNVATETRQNGRVGPCLQSSAPNRWNYSLSIPIQATFRLVGTVFGSMGASGLISNKLCPSAPSSPEASGNTECLYSTKLGWNRAIETH